MRAEPFSFREFTGEAVGGKKAVIPTKGGFVSVGGKKVPVPEEKPSAPPPPPTFNEEELKKAEGESYRKGFLDGTKEGQAQAENEQANIDVKLTETVEEFVHAIAPIFEDYAALALQVREELPRIALAIAQKVAGAALAQDAQAVVEDMAMRCCETLIGQPVLSVTVHASLADTLDGKLKAMVANSGKATRISVSANTDIPMSDCKIEWKHGSMERRTEALWEQVGRVVGDMSESAKRDTSQALEVLEENLPKAPARKPKKIAQAEEQPETDTSDTETPTDTTKKE